MLTAIRSQPKPTPKTYFLHRVNLLKLADRTKCSVKTSYFRKHPINFRNNYLTVQGHFWVFIERKIWQIKLTESIAFIRTSRRICVVVCIVSIRVSHPIENLPPQIVTLTFSNHKVFPQSQFLLVQLEKRNMFAVAQNSGGCSTSNMSSSFYQLGRKNTWIFIIAMNTTRSKIRSSDKVSWKLRYQLKCFFKREFFTVQSTIQSFQYIKLIK